MFSRLSQIARHLSAPSHSAIRSSLRQPLSGTMASVAATHHARTINTAACLIIGDEVLGGKVRLSRWALRNLPEQLFD